MRVCAGVFLALALLPVSALHAQPGGEVQAVVENDAAQAALPVLDRLNAAWDAGDGAAFAAQFTADADVINIFGERYRGGPDLVRRMQFIFDGIFRGSKHLERNLEIARAIGDGTILVVTSSVIDVPQGPLAPQTRNRQTFILVLDDGAWRIRHWHNTTIGGPRGA